MGLVVQSFYSYPLYGALEHKKVMTCNLLFFRFKENDAGNVLLHELLREKGCAKSELQTVPKNK